MLLYIISACCGQIWKGTRSELLPSCCGGPCCCCCCWCCNCECCCCCWVWIIVSTLLCVEPGDGFTAPCKECENNSVDTIGTGTVIGMGSTFTPCTLLDVGNCTLVSLVLHRFACWHGFDGLYGIPAWNININQWTFLCFFKQTVFKWTTVISYI